ncbi:MAG: protein phosphatase 2C domain-containing protein [Propionibacteriaceae bacterium]|nr:protein phosphatase 2C domain-containing protein [Propionibacteriaceae bacterium]
MTVLDDVKLSVASATDIGHRRAFNEDAVLAERPVFIVADGMGGHDAGDRASAIVIDEMSKLGADPSVEDVRDALTRARWSIDSLEASHTWRAAGTTVSGIVLVRQDGWPYWLVINLGDSRTYRVVGDTVNQVSVDHSEAQEMIEAGRLDAVSARTYSRRNVITRVLGARTVERPDYWLIPVMGPGRWMICSDGLTTELTETEIARIVTQPLPAHEVVTQLVSAALAAGGRDNVSVVIVDVEDFAGDPGGATVDDTMGLADGGQSGEKDQS